MGGIGATTYVYSYIAFAVVYVASALAFSIALLRMRSIFRELTPASDTDPLSAEDLVVMRGYLHFGSRLLDLGGYAILIPFAYLAVTFALGTLVAGGRVLTASVLNMAWALLTGGMGIASLLLAIFASRNARALKLLFEQNPEHRMLHQRTLHAVHNLRRWSLLTVAILLGTSFFTIWNIVAVLANIQGISGADFAL
ncbi:MAG: hypothetical protein WC971_06795 [Coriobacteriia bacterium]